VRSRCCLALPVPDRAEAPLEVCGMCVFASKLAPTVGSLPEFADRGLCRLGD